MLPSIKGSSVLENAIAKSLNAKIDQIEKSERVSRVAGLVVIATILIFLFVL